MNHGRHGRQVSHLAKQLSGHHYTIAVISLTMSPLKWKQHPAQIGTSHKFFALFLCSYSLAWRLQMLSVSAHLISLAINTLIGIRLAEDCYSVLSSLLSVSACEWASFCYWLPALVPGITSVSVGVSLSLVAIPFFECRSCNTALEELRTVKIMCANQVGPKRKDANQKPIPFTFLCWSC